MTKPVFLLLLLLSVLNSLASENELLVQTIASLNESELKDSINNLYRSYEQLIEVDSDSAELISNHWIAYTDKTEYAILSAFGYILKGNALFGQEEFDEANYYYLNAKEKFEQQNSLQGVIISLNHLGLSERAKNNFELSLKYFSSALQLSTQNDMPDFEADAYNYLGGIYLRQTNYAEADAYFKRALNIREILQDSTGVAASRINIALVKRETGEFEEALQNLQQAIDIYKATGNNKGVSEVATIQGSIFFRKSDFNTALEYYYQAYRQRSIEGNINLISRSATNIGTVYKNLSMADSAIKYYDIALELNQQLKNRNALASSLNNLGNLYYELENLSLAMEYYIRALSVREQEENTPELASTLKNIGNIYTSINRYDKALEYYLRAVDIEESLGDQKRLAYTLDFIGTSYKMRENYEMALEYFNRTLGIRKKIGNQKEIAITLNNIGDLYYVQEKYEDAKKYYEMSLKAGELAGDKWRIAQELNNIGNIHSSLDDNDKALETFKMAYEINREIRNRFGEALTGRKIGEILLKKEEFNKAIPYIEQSLNIGMQLKNQLIIKNALYALYEYYRAFENYEKAMLYLYDYFAVQDSMLTQMSNKQIYDIQLNFELEKKEQEILQIQKEKDELSFEKKLKDEVIYRKNIVLISLLILLVLLLLIITLIFNRYKYRKLVTKTLNEKLEIIEKTNEALRNSQEQLLTSNATKDKFFSIIAHDLKNPIGGLMMASEALDEAKDLTAEEKREYVSVMHTSSKQLYSLLDNLLLWSRSQTGRIKLNPRMIFLKKISQDSIDLQKINADNKNITIQNRIPDEMECYADQELLGTVMRNLMSNAVKFTNNKGKIVISAKEKKDSVDVYISDTGVGMTGKQLENLFRIDQAASTNGTNNESGTGLGLIIAKEFVELNKGHLLVESSVGRGTTFIITLPKTKYHG